MTIDEFIATLAQPKPPAGLPPVLEGLWQDAKGNWSEAHEVAQGKEGTKAFDRLHAYLHRKEGDAFNAKYWYRRAGADVFQGTLEQEWAALVKENLKAQA